MERFQRSLQRICSKHLNGTWSKDLFPKWLMTSSWILRPRLSTVMRYARTTQFNWPDIWHCGVRQELTCPSSYVPTTRFLKRPA